MLQFTYMAMLDKGSEENYLIMMFQSMNNYGQDQLVVTSRDSCYPIGSQILHVLAILYTSLH